MYYYMYYILCTTYYVLSVYVLLLLIIYNTKSYSYLYAVNVRFTLIRASCSGLRSGDAQFYNRGWVLQQWGMDHLKRGTPLQTMKHL